MNHPARRRTSPRDQPPAERRRRCGAVLTSSHAAGVRRRPLGCAGGAARSRVSLLCACMLVLGRIWCAPASGEVGRAPRRQLLAGAIAHSSTVRGAYIVCVGRVSDFAYDGVMSPVCCDVRMALAVALSIVHVSENAFDAVLLHISTAYRVGPSPQSSVTVQGTQFSGTSSRPQ